MEGTDRVPTTLNSRTVTAYLYREAAEGHLDAQHTSYLLVLLNLAFNTWWAASAKGNTRGVVMRGKSSKAMIARETCLSPRAVQYSLAWLEERGWIVSEQVYEGGRKTAKDIALLIDTTGHMNRHKIRQTYAEIERLTEGQPLPLPQATIAPT